VPYDAYKIRLATLDFDFTVIPLVENLFNEGKSAIKWYEVSALPRPKPVLAARVPPYSDEIIDGDTGLLYSDHEEFKVKFEALVRDGDLRDRLAKRAKEWVGEYRDGYKTAGPLYEWIVKTIDSTRESRWPLDARLPKRKRKKGV
jgi:glycosyltransferase involved in cell wall biosynthesis